MYVEPLAAHLVVPPKVLIMVFGLLIVGLVGLLAGPWQMFSDRNRTRSVAWYLLHPRAYVGAELWGQKFVWRMEAFWRLCTGYVGIVALVLAAALAMLGVPFRST